jgi:cytoskeletal protein RodZ
VTDTPDPASSTESFGRYLAQQRELRGVSLEQISDPTKLSLSTLRALETDDAVRLPERVFIVGAVRAYAKAVGLSPEETLLRLHESWGVAPVGPAQMVGKKAPPGALRWLLVAAAIAAIVAVALKLGR